MSKNLKVIKNIAEKGLGAMLREMFVIGAESESVLLRWSVRILSVQTEIQKKLQQEMDSVIGKEADVTWEDRMRSVVLDLTNPDHGQLIRIK